MNSEEEKIISELRQIEAQLLRVFDFHFPSGTERNSSDSGEAEQKIREQKRKLAVSRLWTLSFLADMKLGLIHKDDTEKLKKFAVSFLESQSALRQLSPTARLLLGENMERFSSDALPVAHFLEKDSVAHFLDILLLTKWEFSERTPRGKSNKRMDAIAVADECRKMWSSETGQYPSLNVSNPDATPFGQFVNDVFEKLGIDASVRNSFKNLNKSKLKEPFPDMER